MNSANPSSISDLTTAEFLAQHPLFWLITREHLPPDMEPFDPATMAAVRHLLTERQDEVPELIALDKIAAEFRFKKGAILAHQGEYADNLHILREGMLESQYERFVELPNGTKERTYVRDALHLPGAWLSDRWVFQPMLYPYYLRARRDGCVILITREKFLDFLKRHPKVLRRIYPQFTPEAQQSVRNSRFQEYLGTTSWWSRLLAFIGRGRVNRNPVDDEAARQFDSRLARLHAKFRLQSEESIKFQSRRSPWILIPKLILPIALLIGLPLLVAFLVSSLGIVITGWWVYIVVGLVLLIPLGLAILQYIDWANDWFLVTDLQVIHYEFELFRFRSQLQKIPITNVQSIEVETPNFFAKMFNLGTARITTAAQSEVMFFDFITRPGDVQRAINEVRERSQSLNYGKTLREMRHAAEDYFNVPHVYTQIKYRFDEAPSWVSERWKRVRGFLDTYSHRVERNGVVTYHKHRITLLGAIIPPILFGIFILASWYILTYFVGISFANALGRTILVVLFLVDLGLLIWQFEDWRNDTYQITDRYVIDIDRAPFGFNESRKQAELSKVENVRTEQTGFIANIFNFGRVYVETAGATSSIVFEQVYDPNTVQGDLFKRLNNLRAKNAKEEDKRRRAEYAIFMDVFDKTAKVERVPQHKPLLEEDEEGVPPD